MLRAAVAALALAAAPAAADDLAPSRDPGGSVALRVIEIAALEARREPVRIEGECLSACTMYLGLSTACFGRNSVLGFHAPRRPDGRPLPPRAFEAATRAMADYYPARLRAWWLEEGRHSDAMIRVPAARLIDRCAETVKPAVKAEEPGGPRKRPEGQ